MSTQSTIPWFGRTWSLDVTSADGSNTYNISKSDNDPNSLRITFDIEMTIGKALWMAEICIYNLDTNPNPATGWPGITSMNLNSSQAPGAIGEGSVISLSAGYEAEGHPAEIWKGTCFQSMWEKEDATTTKLTLRCIAGYAAKNKIVSLSFAKGTTQYQQLQSILQSSGSKIGYVAPESQFTTQTSPRGIAIFDNVLNAVYDIARNNGMEAFIDGNGAINIGKFKREDSVSDIIYSSPIPPGTQGITEKQEVDYVLLGSPQQTQWGVNFRVLLDSRLRVSLPPVQVKIDNSVIRLAELQIGRTPPWPFTDDSQYLVAAVRHVGDSRGNTWETQVTAINRNYAGVQSGISQ